MTNITSVTKQEADKLRAILASKSGKLLITDKEVADAKLETVGDVKILTCKTCGVSMKEYDAAIKPHSA